MPAILVVAVYLATGIAGAALIGWYAVVAARLTQAIMFDLRKRIFLHTQRLSLEFHESYTRSEEHTSELQSLMRISYAVFCLKKKTYHTHLNYRQPHNDNQSINIPIKYIPIT